MPSTLPLILSQILVHSKLWQRPIHCLLPFDPRFIGESDRAAEMGGVTVFETKSVLTGKKRKREGKGDPGDVEGYKGPWREYVDQVKVAKPTDEEKAAMELMFASKKKEKKEEGQTIEESSMLHGK